jgi:two-component system OmpR family response regulator
MTSPARLLLIEDDERLAELVSAALEKAGYAVQCCGRGDEGEALMRAQPFELVLLDGHLPGKDGFDVLRDVRRDFKGRIVMLTARDDDIDQILGLEGGADDYIAKPVAPRVLLARIKALLRRDGSPATDAAPNPAALGIQPGRGVGGEGGGQLGGEVGSDVGRGVGSPGGAPGDLRFRSLTIKPASREVWLGPSPLEMTTAEYDLLHYLASRAGEVVSRDDIMQALRGLEFDGLDRAIDARVSRLRKKIGDDAQGPAARIKTVRGKGYLFSRD